MSESRLPSGRLGGEGDVSVPAIVDPDLRAATDQCDSLTWIVVHTVDDTSYTTTSHRRVTLDNGSFTRPTLWEDLTGPS